MNNLGDDEDNMKLKVKIFQGKFETATQALKLTFDNNEISASNLRTLVGLDENDTAVSFAIKCLPNAKQSDIDDFIDFMAALIKTSEMLEESEFPFMAVNPTYTEESYGEKVFRVTCPLKSELSGMAVGVVQAAGVNHVEVELRVDEKNQSGCFALDVDVSRNAIELAQEMAGLPAEIASFAQMYNESDMTFKFKSWNHLANNPVIGELVPKEFAEEVQSFLNGSGVETLAKKLSQQALQELVVNDSNGVFGPFFAKAMACFLEITDVQFVVGNAVFKCKIEAPGLIQQFNVPIPDSPNKDDENIDPTNYPSPFTAPHHEHELTLTNNLYGGIGFACDKCSTFGRTYAYHCEICQYDLHPKCALDQ